MKFQKDWIPEFSGKYNFLSNFSNSPIKYEGIVYPTVEHAFQAAKTLNINKRLRLRTLLLPVKQNVLAGVLNCGLIGKRLK